jgi:hypothetical protein
MGPNYARTEADSVELEKRFTHHPPMGDQASRYQAIRESAKAHAELLERLCPGSRELSLSKTKLEESVMWANASIARNE